MNEPNTWNEDMATESGRWPHSSVHAESGSSTSAHIDNSTNKPMPWIAVACILASLALGISIADIATRTQIFNEIRNRAIDAETQSLLLRSHVDELRFEMVQAGIDPPPLPDGLNVAR